MGQFEERVAITEPAGADRMRTSNAGNKRRHYRTERGVAPDAGIIFAWDRRKVCFTARLILASGDTARFWIECLPDCLHLPRFIGMLLFQTDPLSATRIAIVRDGSDGILRLRLIARYSRSLNLIADTTENHNAISPVSVFIVKSARR